MDLDYVQNTRPCRQEAVARSAVRVGLVCGAGEFNRVIKSVQSWSAGLVAVMLSLGGPVLASAEEIRLAVASNFANTIREIAGRFEDQTGHEVALSFASTGKHYAQIKNGAPFDAFFAADERRPRLLEEERAWRCRDLVSTYALGELVLWSPETGVVDSAGEVLESDGFRFLALANPKLAPYGRAAREVLEARDLWQSLQNRIVRGENIGQTYQFVASGSAELGFVARSQIERPGLPMEGSWWEIPTDLYSPIEQQAVLLGDDSAARDFLVFARGKEALKIIRLYGYGTP